MSRATTDALASWADTAAKAAITAFVEATTDPASADFVPVEDRVAVFDNDGTLTTEMPLYTQLAFALDRATELGQPMTLDDLRTGGIGAVLELVKLTHGSVTTVDFDAAARRWAATARDPRFGRLYPDLAYQPMLELLAYLDQHEFTCWIFSGGGTDFMRAWAPEVYGLAPHRFLGSSGSTTFSMESGEPSLLKGADLAVMNDGPQKPVSIHQHVGQRPILAAGNTDGDLPMLQWSAAGPHRSLQLVVHHTDGDREYAYDRDPILGSGTEALLRAASDRGWTVIDMADDWNAVHRTTA